MINNNVNVHVSLELYFVINIIPILGHSQRNEKFNLLYVQFSFHMHVHIEAEDFPSQSISQ